jgi:hypothetical protein
MVELSPPHWYLIILSQVLEVLGRTAWETGPLPLGGAGTGLAVLFFVFQDLKPQQSLALLDRLLKVHRQAPGEADVAKTLARFLAASHAAEPALKVRGLWGIRVAVRLHFTRLFRVRHALVLALTRLSIPVFQKKILETVGQALVGLAEDPCTPMRMTAVDALAQTAQALRPDAWAVLEKSLPQQLASLTVAPTVRCPTVLPFLCVRESPACVHFRPAATPGCKPT